MEDWLTSTRYLASYYFWYFSAVGVFEPYLTAFWRQSGFPSARIGLLNSIMPGVAAFAPFLWTAYADATRQGERIFLLVASAMARMSFGPYQTFFTIHLERLGLSRTFAGAAWALAAASELIVMLCWARMCERASARAWLIAALASFPLRWVLSLFAHDAFMLLVAQLTHALTFGVFYLAAVQTVDALVPDGLRASAQGLYASVTFGLGDLLGNALAGILYEPLGMARLYVGATAVSAVATVLYWVGTRQAAASPAIARVRVPEGEPR